MQYGCELHRRLVVSSKNNRKIFAKKSNFQILFNILKFFASSVLPNET